MKVEEGLLDDDDDDIITLYVFHLRIYQAPLVLANGIAPTHTVCMYVTVFVWIFLCCGWETNTKF